MSFLPGCCILSSKVWSYLYTTAGEDVKDAYLANGGNSASAPPPLAGLGYGLPLRYKLAFSSVAQSSNWTSFVIPYLRPSRYINKLLQLLRVHARKITSRSEVTPPPPPPPSSNRFLRGTYWMLYIAKSPETYNTASSSSASPPPPRISRHRLFHPIATNEAFFSYSLVRSLPYRLLSNSRLYARNFGGELQLRSVAGKGMKATLRLSRHGTRLEPLVWPQASDEFEEVVASRVNL